MNNYMKMYWKKGVFFRGLVALVTRNITFESRLEDY